METAKEIGEYKTANGIALTDEKREKVVIENARAAVPDALSDYAEELMIKLISLSKDYQNKI